MREHRFSETQLHFPITTDRNMTPTISVIIPAYNAGAYLADAVQSALNQTRSPDEILVMDDGSTDNTTEIAATFGSRIRYLRQPNSGVMATRNHSIQKATGEWIAFLDADDAWYPRKLELQLEALGKISGDALVCTNAVVFRDGAVPPPEAMRLEQPVQISIERLLQKNYIATSTVLVPKRQLLKVGGFTQRYNHAEDWAVWLKMAAQGTPIWLLPQPLTAYRLSPNALGSRDPSYLREVEVQIIRDFVREQYPSASWRVCRQAIAGNHIRTAFNYDEIHRHWKAIIEIARSCLAWPFSLPAYSKNNRLLRLRLFRRLLAKLP